MNLRIGIDLGGTKIEIVVLGEGGEELLRRRVETPASTYGEILAALVALVTAAENELGSAASVGIGTPGALSPTTGLLRNSNTTALNHTPFKQDIEQRLGREVRIANDANCFALSEAVDGAGAGASVVFGVIVGTGTGGGLVIHGSVITGVNAIGGEWGHNPLPWPNTDELPGPDCYCGRAGCIETWLSGPGLQAAHLSTSGQQLEPAGIVAAAEAGDTAAERTLRRYENRMARSLAHVINIVDPDVIVLGGGMSNVARLYNNVPAGWIEHVFSDAVATRLVPPVHGDASGVRGAAWLW